MPEPNAVQQIQSALGSGDIAEVRRTLLMAQGEDEVLSVEGSIKYAFNKALKDWRNRAITDDPPEHVQAVTFESTNGTWRFERAGDDWQHRPGEGQTAIERFAPSKVQSVVSSLARMRAVNFAAADVDAEEAGLAPPSATVRSSPRTVAPAKKPTVTSARSGRSAMVVRAPRAKSANAAS